MIKSERPAKHVLYGFVLVAMVAFASPALGDSVVGTGTNTWQTWGTGNLTENNNPYWDGNSFDFSTVGNIGSYLTNTGAFTGGTGPGVAFDYWGASVASGGAADLNFHFSKSDPGQLAALKLEVAGNMNINSFGWFDTTNIGTLHELFNGPTGAGAIATFVPSLSYGYYLTGADGTFYTLSSNDPGSSFQHFAVFKENDSSYWLGIEDLKLSSSDKDYQDMVIHVTAAVPEPGSMMLLGSGLVGLGIALRRRFFRR